MSVKLPPLPKPPAREYKGPTPWCNWAIKDIVLAGAYPASLSDEETTQILRTLLEVGVTTFVCLQQEVSIDCPEHLWRKGEGLRPYIHDAQRILRQAHENPGSTGITQTKIDFLHLPIVDGGISSDSAMDRLAEDCIARVKKGEKLYIHCWGGHGRTGTLVAVMLGRLYNLSYAAALHCTQLFHDARRYPQGVRSPTTAIQRAQVRRLLASTAPAPAPAPAPVRRVTDSDGAMSAASAQRSLSNLSLNPRVDVRRSMGAPSFMQPSSARSATATATAAATASKRVPMDDGLGFARPSSTQRPISSTSALKGGTSMGIGSRSGLTGSAVRSSGAPRDQAPAYAAAKNPVLRSSLAASAARNSPAKSSFNVKSIQDSSSLLSAIRAARP